MTRTKKLVLNMFSGAGRQIATILCGFIFTRFLLVTYGSEVNGLVASITQFLGFISFLEMGIGPVIQSNLYKPLADGDIEQVSRIFKSSKKFFRRIGYIFIGYIIILCFLLPLIISTSLDKSYIVSLLIIISISTFTQYFFGMPNQLLLNADQRSYIQITISTVTLIINTICCILLMKFGASIQIVKLCTSLIYLFRPVLFEFYVKRHYSLVYKIEYEIEPIKQKWNGFAQHISAVVTDSTDVIILTFLSTMGNVSIYTVYYSVIHGITLLTISFANGLSSLWGNMLAKNEIVELNNSFSFMEWCFHTFVTIIFTVTGIMIIPFVSIYTNNVTDVNYIQPLFAYILVVAFAIRCIRLPYFNMITAAGHYKQTQLGAIISMLLNLGISIPFVYLFGLVGVAIGTFVAMAFHTVYCCIYLAHNVLKRSVMHFVLHIVVDILEIFCSVLLCSFIFHDVSSYIQWCILAIEVFIICSLVVVLINSIIYKRNIKIIITKLFSKKVIQE